jgi:Tfp pilus assembly pilus retraction ATPase PilT
MPLDLDRILNEAVDAGASDIHLKPPAEPRMRVAGELLPMASHPAMPSSSRKASSGPS